jgi:hypothetical protein
VLALALSSALGGCGRSETGVHIYARAGAIEYDELRFQVTRADGEIVVDPMTTGRYQGPFASGDQDVLVYLRDDLAGSQVRCEASALRAGAEVSRGASDVTVARGEMKRVEIVMDASGGGGGDGGSTGAGGSGAGDPGGSGTGGGGPGGSGPGGSSGGGPGGSSGTPPAKPNGEACSVDGECVSHHCADGVCCESDCGMACHSCGLPDSPGLCRPVAGGTPDPRGKCKDEGAPSCKTTGVCGAAGECAVYPAGTACAPAGCDGAKAESVVPAGVCDGAGRCEIPVKIKCGPAATCVAGVCTDAQPPMP